MSDEMVVALVDEGLGNSAYLVDLGGGRALVVDVSLDLRAVRAIAAERGLEVAFAADTHLHADFLSGARQLSITDGARVLASAAGQRAFPHAGLRAGHEVDLGGLRLRALGTPGHTAEHLSFLLLDGARPVGVFTGGSLLVGAAARTDLVAPDRTEAPARARHAALRRHAELPDEVAVWPTHGAGSFCSAPPGAGRTSTTGREKATNGSDLPAVPPPLDPARVRALLERGAVLVDVRPVGGFAAAHVPGSLSIPLRPAFAPWLGWLAPRDRPLVFARSPDQDGVEIAWQAAKVGFGNVAGELAGGVDSRTAAGLPVAGTRVVGPGGVRGRPVLDVRQAAEFRAGHLPGALHLELGDLPRRAGEVPDGPPVVMCGHGERAMSAAGVLERAGRRDLVVLAGGPEDWARATGGRLDSAA
ncbi:rhodanese-like domain-containing protein [Actinosynnema sp. NPDC091369]